MKQLSKKQKRQLLQKHQNAVDPMVALKNNLKQDMRKDMLRIVNLGVEQAINHYLKTLLLTLHDDFGFGQKRLEKVLDGMQNRAKDVRNGLISTEDIENVLEKEANLNLTDYYARQVVKNV